MQDPVGAFRSLGAGGFASVQLTLGAAILSALVHGPWSLWCLACLASPHLTLGPVGLAGLVLSLVTGAFRSVSLGQPLAQVRRYLTLPFYWPLQTLAMIRALWSLAAARITGPGATHQL
ncbi:MAG: hypothetical protein R3C04_10490 [Hyphomonas sp.]